MFSFILEFEVKLVDVLKPLLNGIKEKSVNAEEFERLAYEYYNTLNSFSKDLIIEFNRKHRGKEEPERPSFVVLY